MQVGVIGAGKWGSALAYAMSEKNDVLINSRTPRDLPNFVSLERILECEYLIITVPAQQIAKAGIAGMVSYGQLLRCLDIGEH